MRVSDVIVTLVYTGEWTKDNHKQRGGKKKPAKTFVCVRMEKDD